MKAKINSGFALYMCMLLSVFGIVLFTITKQSGLVSLLFYGTFLLLLLGIVQQVVNTSRISFLYLLGIACIFFAFIHVYAQTQDLSFEHFKKLIIFFCSVLFIPFVHKISVDKRVVDWILIINIFIGLLYVLFYALGVRDTIGGGLTFGFPNPNQTGMFIAHSVLYSLLSFVYFEKYLVKGLLLLLSVALIVLDYLTLARSSLIAIAFFCIPLVLVVFFKKRYVPGRLVSFLLLISPLLIAGVYMWMADNDLLSWLDFMSLSEGKTGTTRVGIWTDAFQIIKEHFWFGKYTGMDQLHNTHLDTLATYGFLPFVFFMALLTVGARSLLHKEHSLFSSLALWAFYAVIVMGAFEGSLVTGGVGLHILSFGFLLLAGHKEQEAAPVTQEKEA